MTRQTVTVDQMIATINERIEFLGAIRASLAFAMAGTLVTESTAVSTVIKPRQVVKAKAKRRYTKVTPVKPLILHVLGDYSSAQTVTDILNSVLGMGWKSSSDNKRGVLQATLTQMVKKGVLQRVGNGYALTQETVLDTQAEVAA